MNRKFLQHIFVLAGVVASAAVQCGAENDSTMVVLDGVVVESGVRAHDISRGTATFTVGREALKTRGVENVTDALRRLPGLNIRDYGGAGGMKSVSVRGLGANHTGVVYDGVPLGNCRSGQIDLSRYDIGTVKSIGVQSGDSEEMLASSRAVAAASSIYINTGADDNGNRKTSLEASVKCGSFGLMSTAAKLGVKVSPEVTLKACGSFTHALNDYPYRLVNGKQSTWERRKHSLMNSGYGDVSMCYRPDELSKLEVKGYWYDSYRQLPGQVVLYNPVSNESLREKNGFVQASYLNSSLRDFSFKVFGKYNRDYSKYLDIHGKYPGGRMLEEYSQNEFYFSAVAKWTVSRLWHAAYSADYAYNDLTGNMQGVVHPSRNTILQTVSLKYAGKYFKVTGRMLWSLYYNSVEKGECAANANRVSPSVAVSVKPFDAYQMYIRGSYKNIFRMPTFNDSYYYHQGSVPLKPEDTELYNLGIAWMGKTGIVNAISLTADLFYNSVHNKIVAIPQNMYIWAMSNMDKARSFGVDATAAISIALPHRQKLLMDGNYTFQRVQPRTSPKDADYNKQMAYTPVHSGTGSVCWQNRWVNVVASVIGASDMYGTNANLPVSLVKGYTDVGLGLSHDFKIRKVVLSLSGNVRNIFNTQYELVADYPMPGRQYSFTLSLKM